jgi:hypothetical protein
MMMARINGRGRSMRAGVSILLLMAVSAPASAQQLIALAELQGKIMQATALSDRVMRRDGRQFPEQYQTDWKIIFEPGDTIDVTFIGTSSTARGKVQSPIDRWRPKLEQPRETPTRGGGHMIWIFDNGALNFLRTYEGGAMKASFTFARGGEVPTCAASVLWLREVGVSAIILKSFVDNARLEILSSKQASSRCQVTTPNASTTQ